MPSAFALVASPDQVGIEPSFSRRYNVRVEKTVRIFTSLKDADEADVRSDMKMSPEERIRIVIELRDHRHSDAAEQGACASLSGC